MMTSGVTSSDLPTVSLRVLDIVEGTSVDGPHLRSAVYLAGCTHRCKGCHNPQSWDPDGGYTVGIESLCRRLDAVGMDVTFSGGDPMMQAGAVAEAARILLTRYGRHSWCYTGYTFEQVAAHPVMSHVLQWIDVLVDGRFELDGRDTSLLFRGSPNQRLVDVAHWRATGEITEWRSGF